MGKDKDKKQLRFFNCDNVSGLSQSKNKDKLKEAGQASRSDDNSGEFFDNQIGVITVEELAVLFGLAPQTIRNWVAQGKLPYVKIGKRNMFLVRSVQEWINRKEEPQWQ